MIRRYDRGEYTQVGIDVGDDSFVSCRTGSGLLRAGEGGGVRLDRFDDVTERPLFRAAVLLEEDEKKLALERCLAWVDHSGFSFPKLLQSTVAVDACRPEAEFDDDARSILLGTAFAAAESWRHGSDRPAFTAAEMIVEAYGRPVPTAHLAPPSPSGAPRDILVHAASLGGEVIEQWEPDERGRTMASLVAAVTRYDPDFFAGALRSVWGWLRTTGHRMDDLLPTARDNWPQNLPSALVTPRMLLRCDWVGEPAPV
ncbi:hypothetical protein [Actinomycetospora termitidis]|uniref:DUF429 domain-containing protein n=1 Tax=Actinomycetospora termitidis TaxID=3053470 RepID=A0ABT7ME68_9PSEU|nr:hypothetical protein [Actinomycetospora sp. Odt1-22]MDL5158961.1 hypothetical protein [Actinomycetospora sp. Odt1-22]